MRKWLVLALSLGLAGCDPGSTLPEDPPHVGIFTLVSVDGKPVPAVVFEEGARKIELVGGLVGFNELGQAVSRQSYRITDANGTRTLEVDDAGSYTVSGTRLEVTWEGERQETYTRDVTTLTVFDGTLTLVFRK